MHAHHMPGRPHAGRRRAIATTLLAVLTAALTALVLVTAVTAQPEPVAPVGNGPVMTDRVSGPTRIDTAVAISQRAFPEGADAAYLADATTGVDAITGGSLTDGPILLVGGCALSPAVADELARLRPQEVVALGGSAAVCDAVLEEAGLAAAGASHEPGEPAELVVTTSTEVLDASSQPPFTVDSDDIGLVYDGATFAHAITFTATGDESVTLDDPRFSGVLSGGDAGRMVVAGRGCAPTLPDDTAEPRIACTDDLLLVTASPGAPASTTVRLHTADTQVGDAPLRAGTYVLDQPVRWDDQSDGEVFFDEGSATIRVTYTVSSPEDQAVVRASQVMVTWDTPEGSFTTRGHSAADLERIREGVAQGTHIGIPNGQIHPGDGGVNTGHDWHVTGIELADITMEVCDGTAAHVDANLEDFLQVGFYCPWGAVPTATSG